MNLISSTLKLHHSAEVATFNLPALMLNAEKAVASILQGEHTHKKSGQGERFWQFRDYVPGDRPQDIDWRQSAKADRIYIRQKERQTTQSAVFWCNKTSGMNFTSNRNLLPKGEVAKIMTLAIAILMIRAGEQISLFGDTRTGRTEAALHRIGESLSAAKYSNTEELPDAYAYSLPRHCSLIQVGDFLMPPDEIDIAFKKLSAHTDNGLVIQILDPAELELPYSGRYVFVDPSAKIQEHVAHVDSIRDSYKKRINDHIDAVRTICRNQKWEYHLHITDQDIGNTLMKVWESMSIRNTFQSAKTTS